MNIRATGQASAETRMIMLLDQPVHVVPADSSQMREDWDWQPKRGLGDLVRDAWRRGCKQ